MIQQVRDGTGTVYLDHSHYPILISTWIGDPTVAICRTFSAWHVGFLQNACRSGQRIIAIADSTRTGQASSAVRHYFAEWTSSQTDELREANLMTLVVVPNPVVRGVLAAIGWVSSAARDITPVPTREMAIERALRLLDLHGIARPVTLSVSTYRPPA